VLTLRLRGNTNLRAVSGAVASRSWPVAG
jgi:hypothetical protein